MHESNACMSQRLFGIRGSKSRGLFLCDRYPFENSFLACECGPPNYFEEKIENQCLVQKIMLTKYNTKTNKKLKNSRASRKIENGRLDY